jgi:hypothetical protein
MPALWETNFSDLFLNELPTGFRLLYHIRSSWVTLWCMLVDTSLGQIRGVQLRLY